MTLPHSLRALSSPNFRLYWTGQAVSMFFIGVAPIGHYTAGWLAEHVGAPRTFVAGGVMAITTGILFILQMKAFRSRLREAYAARGIIAASEDTRMGNP